MPLASPPAAPVPHGAASRLDVTARAGATVEQGARPWFTVFQTFHSPARRPPQRPVCGTPGADRPRSLAAPRPTPALRPWPARPMVRGKLLKSLGTDD
jgi:hypothetical protein